eukprot:ANDGO_03740.mRNA.1 hypothetical protein
MRAGVSETSLLSFPLALQLPVTPIDKIMQHESPQTLEADVSFNDLILLDSGECDGYEHSDYRSLLRESLADMDGVHAYQLRNYAKVQDDGTQTRIRAYMDESSNLDDGSLDVSLDSEGDVSSAVQLEYARRHVASGTARKESRSLTHEQKMFLLSALEAEKRNRNDCKNDDCSGIQFVRSVRRRDVLQKSTEPTSRLPGPKIPSSTRRTLQYRISAFGEVGLVNDAIKYKRAPASNFSKAVERFAEPKQEAKQLGGGHTSIPTSPGRECSVNFVLPRPPAVDFSHAPPRFPDNRNAVDERTPLNVQFHAVERRTVGAKIAPEPVHKPVIEDDDTNSLSSMTSHGSSSQSSAVSASKVVSFSRYVSRDRDPNSPFFVKKDAGSTISPSLLNPDAWKNIRPSAGNVFMPTERRFSFDSETEHDFPSSVTSDGPAVPNDSFIRANARAARLDLSGSRPGIANARASPGPGAYDVANDATRRSVPTFRIVHYDDSVSGDPVMIAKNRLRKQSEADTLSRLGPGSYNPDIEASSFFSRTPVVSLESTANRFSDTSRILRITRSGEMMWVRALGAGNIRDAILSSRRGPGMYPVVYDLVEPRSRAPFISSTYRDDMENRDLSGFRPFSDAIPMDFDQYLRLRKASFRYHEPYEMDAAFKKRLDDRREDGNRLVLDPNATYFLPHVPVSDFSAATGRVDRVLDLEDDSDFTLFKYRCLKAAATTTMGPGTYDADDRAVRPNAKAATILPESTASSLRPTIDGLPWPGVVPSYDRSTFDPLRGDSFLAPRIPTAFISSEPDVPDTLPMRILERRKTQEQREKVYDIQWDVVLPRIPTTYISPAPDIRRESISGARLELRQTENYVHADYRPSHELTEARVKGPGSFASAVRFPEDLSSWVGHVSVLHPNTDLVKKRVSSANFSSGPDRFSDDDVLFPFLSDAPKSDLHPKYDFVLPSAPSVSFSKNHEDEYLKSMFLEMPDGSRIQLGKNYVSVLSSKYDGMDRKLKSVAFSEGSRFDDDVELEMLKPRERSELNVVYDALSSSKRIPVARLDAPVYAPKKETTTTAAATPSSSKPPHVKPIRRPVSANPDSGIPAADVDSSRRPDPLSSHRAVSTVLTSPASSTTSKVTAKSALSAGVVADVHNGDVPQHPLPAHAPERTTVEEVSQQQQQPAVPEDAPPPSGDVQCQSSLQKSALMALLHLGNLPARLEDAKQRRINERKSQYEIVKAKKPARAKATETGDRSPLSGF